MCRICEDYENQKITAEQALRQIGQIESKDISSEHLIEFSGRLLDVLCPAELSNDEFDQQWWQAHHTEE